MEISLFMAYMYWCTCRDELAEFDKSREGQLVKDFLRQVWSCMCVCVCVCLYVLAKYGYGRFPLLCGQMMMLPAVGGIRESLVMQFVRFLKLKAVTVCKYLETDVWVCRYLCELCIDTHVHISFYQCQNMCAMWFAFLYCHVLYDSICHVFMIHLHRNGTVSC